MCVKSILSALVAEQQLLDQYLQGIPVRNWEKTTNYMSMTIISQISYLAGSEDLAFQAIKKKGKAFEDYKGNSGIKKFQQEQINKGTGMRHQDVIEWWRLSRAKIIELLAESSPSRKIMWWKNEWDMQIFGLYKLTETWAHSLDIYNAVNDDFEDTERLEHISNFCWQQVENTSRVNKIKSQDLRVELIGPGYKAWQYGDPNSSNIIKGSAGEWCRLATGRIKPKEKVSLSATGPFAERYLKFNHPMI